MDIFQAHVFSKLLGCLREDSTLPSEELEGLSIEEVACLHRETGANTSIPQLLLAIPCLKIAFDGLYCCAKMPLSLFRCQGSSLSVRHLLRRFLSRYGLRVHLLPKPSVDLFELLCPLATVLLSLK